MHCLAHHPRRRVRHAAVAAREVGRRRRGEARHRRLGREPARRRGGATRKPRGGCGHLKEHGHLRRAERDAAPVDHRRDPA
eukprot:scaffold97846_cov63-Phaeocystis_antarctica.AAC.2